MKGLKGTQVFTSENYLLLKGAEDGKRSLKPVVATSPQAVRASTLYRVIPTADMNFYLSKEDSPAAADAGDVLMKAGVPFILDTGIYDKFVFTGGGTVQMTELGI